MGRQKGFKHSEKTKDKIRQLHIGKKHPYMKTKKYRTMMSKLKMGNQCAKNYKHSESTKRKNSLAHKNLNKGDKHWNWQGGKTKLRYLIYKLSESQEWRKQVFERDNFTCQDCNYVGKNLEAHHIKPFCELLDEFLQEYNQFSPIEDKETLVRLAINYIPLWDINNGETLCKKCHNLSKNGWTNRQKENKS